MIAAHEVARRVLDSNAHLAALLRSGRRQAVIFALIPYIGSAEAEARIARTLVYPSKYRVKLKVQPRIDMRDRSNEP